MGTRLRWWEQAMSVVGASVGSMQEAATVRVRGRFW